MLGVEIVQWTNTPEDRERAEARLLDLYAEGFRVKASATSAPNADGTWTAHAILILDQREETP